MHLLSRSSSLAGNKIALFHSVNLCEEHILANLAVEIDVSSVAQPIDFLNRNQFHPT